MEYRKGKYYIERYCYDDGSREWYNEEENVFTHQLRDATGYPTTFLANAIIDKIEREKGYSYKVQFCDDYPLK